MRRLYDHIVSFLKKNNPTMFLPFLVIALLLWYANKLTHSYTTDTRLILNIEDSYKRRENAVKKQYTLDVSATADGYVLLKNRLMPRNHAVTVNIDELPMSPSDTNRRFYIVDIDQLAGMLNAKTSGITVNKLLNSLVIEVSPTEIKQVPVVADLSINCARQYMQVGPVKIEPATVSVKGSKSILDTLRAVHTYPKKLENLFEPYKGSLRLLPIEGVILPDVRIDFFVDIEQYTEMDVVVPVRAKGVPAGYRAILFPDKVTVRCNVGEKSYDKIVPENFIIEADCTESNAKDRTKVKLVVSATPVGVKIIKMDPLYADVLFEKLPPGAE